MPEKKDIEKNRLLFFSKKRMKLIRIDKYNTHELELNFTDNKIKIYFSKYDEIKLE